MVYIALFSLLLIMNNFLTQSNEKEGKVGIGTIPNELIPLLDDISAEYVHRIPDKSSTTYHTYYDDLTGKLKENFDKIQYHPFWNGTICDKSNCIQHCVTEMNEIYYSNPKPNFDKHNLYGAAANLIPHRDCILYNFYGIRFYRVIIGLTDKNNDTTTEFINLKVEHKINRGDYMLFDFDRTFHRVKKTGQQETPRILMKLHFIVCDNCPFSDDYVQFVSYFYKYYYYVARYTEQLGTDPTTFAGFFLGLIWEWPFYTAFAYGTVFVVVSSVSVLNVFFNVQFESQNINKLIFYSFCNLFSIYLVVVSFYYLRYIFYNVK